MKIAITSEGSGLNGRLDPCFGRAQHFVLVDTHSGELLVRDNSTNLDTAHAAGMQAAGTLIGLGAKAVITGKIGPKAFATFESAGVRVYSAADGTVAGAVEQLTRGQLTPLSRANAQEHSTHATERDAHATP